MREVVVRAMYYRDGSVFGARLAVGVLITLLVATLVPSLAAASSLEQQRRDAERQLEGVEGKIDDAADELAAIERRQARTAEELAAIEARIEQIKARIAELEVELEEAREALAAAEQALAATEDELDRTNDELEQTREELGVQQDLFADRVRGAFKRSNVSVAAAVLDAKDIHQATRATHFVQRFMSRDVATIEAVTALEARVERALAQLEALRERRDEERWAAEAERDRVAGMLDEQQELRAQADAEAEQRRKALARLEEEERRYEQLVASLESESSKLERQLANIAAEERRLEEQRRAEERRRQQEAERRRTAAASRSGGSGGSSATQSTSQLQRPVANRFRVTSGFGYRTHPIHGTRRLHAGMDFGRSSSGEAINGQPIRAAQSGTVVSAGRRGGYGLTVVLNHGGGMSTLYAHQSRLAVGDGQRVSRGQTIGYVGTTGTSTAPHLHFEVRINGSPVNPAPYIR